MADSNPIKPPYFPTLTPDDLWESVEDLSPAGGAMGWEDASESITFLLRPDAGAPGAVEGKGVTLPIGSRTAYQKLYDARLLLLGYAWVEGFTTNVSSPPDQLTPPTAGATTERRYRCQRTLPLSHPLMPWMVCTRIDSWQGIGPRGKQDAGVVSPNIDLRSQTVYRGQPLASMTSRYDSIKLTATFTQPKYELYGNTASAQPTIAGGNEYPRFTWIERGSAANFLTLDQGSMVFSEGPGNLQGKGFTAPGYAQAETMENIVINWTKVPEDYICNTAGQPVRFLNALQKVNATTFLSFRPGTLLVESYEYGRYRMPLAWQDGLVRFWTDLKLNLKYFDPPGGKPLRGSTVAGSNVVTNLTAKDGSNPLDGLAVGQRVYTVTGKALMPGAVTVTAFLGADSFQMSSPAVTTLGATTLIVDNRTVFGHLTAPAAPNNYFGIQTAPNSIGGGGVQRYLGTELSWLFYPLTQTERTSVL